MAGSGHSRNGRRSRDDTNSGSLCVVAVAVAVAWIADFLFARRVFWQATGLGQGGFMVHGGYSIERVDFSDNENGSSRCSVLVGSRSDGHLVKMEFSTADDCSHAANCFALGIQWVSARVDCGIDHARPAAGQRGLVGPMGLLVALLVCACGATGVAALRRTSALGFRPEALGASVIDECMQKGVG